MSPVSSRWRRNFAFPVLIPTLPPWSSVKTALWALFTNRTHAAGCNVETEIVRTRSTLRVAPVGARNLLQIVDEHGTRQEYYPDFMSRWHNAFLAEMQVFTDHIRSGTRPMDLTVYAGTAVSEAAYRCKESFETGRMLPIR